MNSFDSETLKSDSVNNGGKVVDSDEEVMVCKLSANKEYDHSLLPKSKKEQLQEKS